MNFHQQDEGFAMIDFDDMQDGFSQGGFSQEGFSQDGYSQPVHDNFGPPNIKGMEPKLEISHDDYPQPVPHHFDNGFGPPSIKGMGKRFGPIQGRF